MYDCFARCALLNCCYLVPRGNQSSFVFVFASIFGLSILNSAIFIMPAFSSCVFVQRVTVMLVGCFFKAAVSTRRGRLPGPLQAFVLAKCDVEAMAAGGRYNCIRRRYWPAFGPRTRKLGSDTHQHGLLSTSFRDFSIVVVGSGKFFRK